MDDIDLRGTSSPLSERCQRSYPKGLMTDVAMSSEERFRVIEVLGAGGMGEVYRVYDRERGQEVAQKRIRAPAPMALVRFKREFRAVEQLDHPGLVRVFELAEDELGLFFTMEYVPGVDLRLYGAATTSPSHSLERVLERSSMTVEATGAGSGTSIPGSGAVSICPGVRTVPPPAVRVRDLAPLANAIPLLIEAIAYLHSHGLVHRDLKPANILVTPDGQVKLLDFGVLAEIGRPAHGGQAGTPGYMAPEQIRGEEPRPATDLFALGVLLYELASGTRPFEGGSRELVWQRTLTQAPTPLSEVAPWVPPALSELCRALLRKDPDERATLADVAAALPAALGARSAHIWEPRKLVAPLVGRAREQASLLRLFERSTPDAFQLVTLFGPSGVGKSSLATWFLDEGRRRGKLALYSCARAQDCVPFGGLDEAIDELAETLRARGGRVADGRDRLDLMQLAGTLFPVLAPRGVPTDRVSAAPPRGAAIEAVARLLASEADAHDGLVLVLDDFQWATGDAIFVLSRVLERASPNWIVLALVRTDVPPTDATRLLAETPHVTTLNLSPLNGSDAEAAFDQRLAGCSTPPSEAERAAILRLADGRPFLIDLAARYFTRATRGADDLSGVRNPFEHAAQALLDECTDQQHEILATCIANNGWLLTSELAELTGTSRGHIEDTIRTLSSRGLLRRDGLRGSYQRVDIYHDGIRPALLHRYASHLVRTHSAVADRLLAVGEISGRLIFHLLDAGRTAEAASRAVQAAEHATAHGAFVLAASVYAVALRDPGEKKNEILGARARILEAAGRYRDAAGCWEELAKSEDRDRRRDALLQQAQCLLAATELRLGRACVERAMEEGLIPRMGRVGTAVRAVQFLFGGRVRANVNALPAKQSGEAAAEGSWAFRDRAKARALVRAAQMISYFDPLGGLAHMVHARNVCVELGLEEGGECNVRLGYFAEFMAAGQRPSARSLRYAKAALGHLSASPTHENLGQAGVSFLEGVASQRRGDWGEARKQLDRVIAASARAGRAATFEHLLFVTHRAQVEVFSETPRELAIQFALFTEAAQSSEAFAISCHLRHIEIALLFLRGDFEEANRIAAASRRAWPADEPSFQRFLVEISVAPLAIYLEGRREERRRINEALKQHRRFRPFDNMYGGNFRSIFALHEAAALRAGDSDASARTVRNLTEGIADTPPLWTASGIRARAYAADATGNPDGAISELRRAYELADRFSQRVQKAIAGYQLGRRLLGDEGAALVAAARSDVRAVGSSDRLLDEDPALR